MAREADDRDGVVGESSEDVVDLDKPSPWGATTPGSERGSHPARRWWRGPRGTAVLVIVVIVFTAALTGWQQRQVYAAKLADERAIGAVRAESVTIRALEGTATDTNLVPVELTVDLLNAADVGVGVSLTDVDAGGAQGAALQLEDPSRQIEVAPARTASMTAPAVVDCSAVDPGQDTGASGRVEVVVAVPGLRRAQALPASGSSTTIADQVTLVCYPGLFSTIEVAGTSLRQDGRLEVSLYNPGTTDQEVATSEQEAAGVSAQPALPVLVPAGATTVVTLSLEPDCALAGRLAGQVLELVVSQGEGLGTVPLPASPESQTITAWVARGIALACG